MVEDTTVVADTMVVVVDTLVVAVEASVVVEALVGVEDMEVNVIFILTRSSSKIFIFCKKHNKLYKQL